MYIKRKNFFSIVQNTPEALFWGLLYYLPFHTFITTWIISYTGSSLLVKSFKDILLIVFTLILSAYILLKNTKVIKSLVSPLNIIIFAYILLNITYMMVGNVDNTARYFSLIVNTRFYILFIVAQSIALHAGLETQDILLKIKKYTYRIGFIVASVGIFQLFMPYHFMKNFGYNNATVNPIFTLDSNENTRRISSTLRGPNPLGVFFVFIITTILGISNEFRKKVPKEIIYTAIVTTVSAVAIFFTYSRSSWIGLVVSLSVLVLLSIGIKYKKYFLVLIIFLLSTLIITILTLKDTAPVQRIIFHTDVENSSLIAKSDAVHLESFHNALSRIRLTPFGCGLGCSGPATFYNLRSPLNIPENYYLQITQELGFIGIVIYIVISFLVVKKLYEHRSSSLAKVFIASFLGISAAGIFMHVWTDDVIAYVWWGLAGLIIGSYNHADFLIASAKRPGTSD